MLSFTNYVKVFWYLFKPQNTEHKKKIGMGKNMGKLSAYEAADGTTNWLN